MGNQCCQSHHLNVAKIRKSFLIQSINKVQPISQGSKISIRISKTAKNEIFDNEKQTAIDKHELFIHKDQQYVELHQAGYVVVRNLELFRDQKSYYFFFKDNKIRSLIPEPGHKLWKKIGSSSKTIVDGDQIRIGKSQYIVRIMKNKQQTLQLQQSQIDSTIECRICFQPSLPNNKLKKYCNCSGSMGYIHKKCLERWIFMKEPVPESNPSIWKIQLQRVKCQICFTTYQEFISEILFDRYSYDNNVILEKITKLKTFLIFNFEKGRQKFNIGRSRDCDYQPTDPTISKSHCLLTYCDGQLKIKDYNTRYGTGVRSKQVLSEKDKYLLKNIEICFQYTI